LAVINGSQDATALVGIAELVVGVQDVIEGEWWLYVETPADLVGCARSRGVGAAGRVGVGEASVALPGPGLCDRLVGGTDRRDRTARRVD